MDEREWLDTADEHRMMLVNLKAVSPNVLDAGATRFVLARSVWDRHELVSLAAAIGMLLRTVELGLPYEEIARRIIADPADGRRADLALTSSHTLTSSLARTACDFGPVQCSDHERVRPSSG